MVYHCALQGQWHKHLEASHMQEQLLDILPEQIGQRQGLWGWIVERLGWKVRRPQLLQH